MRAQRGAKRAAAAGAGEAKGAGMIDTDKSSKREALPPRRRCETFSFPHDGQRYTVNLGFYDDGRLGEIFLDAARSGTAIQNHARDTAVTLSIALQYGCMPETIRHAVTRHADGSAAGPIGTLLDLLAAHSGDPR